MKLIISNLGLKKTSKSYDLNLLYLDIFVYLDIYSFMALSYILSFASFAAIKCHNQKQHCKKEFIWFTYSDHSL